MNEKTYMQIDEDKFSNWYLLKMKQLEELLLSDPKISYITGRKITEIFDSFNLLAEEEICLLVDSEIQND